MQRRGFELQRRIIASGAPANPRRPGRRAWGTGSASEAGKRRWTDSPGAGRRRRRARVPGSLPSGPRVRAPGPRAVGHVRGPPRIKSGDARGRGLGVLHGVGNRQRCGRGRGCRPGQGGYLRALWRMGRQYPGVAVAVEAQGRDQRGRLGSPHPQPHPLRGSVRRRQFCARIEPMNRSTFGLFAIAAALPHTLWCFHARGRDWRWLAVRGWFGERGCFALARFASHSSSQADFASDSLSQTRIQHERIAGF